MLNDFLKRNSWPVVQALATRMGMHLVAAQHDERVGEKDAAALKQFAAA